MRTRAKQFLRAAGSAPLLVSLQGDGKRLKVAERLTIEPAPGMACSRSVSRSGHEEAEIFGMRMHMRYDDIQHGPQQNVVYRDPQLLAGEDAWCLFTCLSSFIAEFELLKYPGIVVFH